MERWAGRLLAIVLVLAMVPAIPAQDAEVVPVLADGTGDVQASVADSPLGNPGGAYDYLDLVSAEVQESKDAFTFSVSTVTLESTFGSGGDTGGGATLYFRHGDTDFRIVTSRCIFCFPGGYMFAYLGARPVDGDDWSTLAAASSFDELGVDPDTATISWTLSRDLLLDQKGAPPFPGRSLTDFWAESWYWTNNAALGSIGGEPLAQFPFRVADRMPNDGTGPLDVPVRFGVEQSGHAHLASPDPFRASNGEATTFVYEVNARNLADTEEVFLLTVRDAPPQWEITLPLPSLSIGPGRNATVPVLVTTPFAHQHGGSTSFLLEMTNVRDPASVGRVELGIRYLDIPQPAGHHDTLFLHSRAFEASDPFSTAFMTVFGGGSGVYMNTQLDDSTAGGEPVPAWNMGTGFTPAGSAGVPAATSTFYWMAYLDPGLRMGLDFDLDGIARLVFPVEAEVLLPAAILTGELAVVGPNECCDGTYRAPWGYRDAHVIANFSSGAPVEIGNGQTHTFEVEFPVLDAADRIPYDPLQNLALFVQIQTERPQSFIVEAERPLMLPGATLSLPLFEYQDEVDGLFQGVQGPVLRLKDVAGKTLNPGDVALFDVTVSAPAGAEGTYDLQLTGLNAGWAEILGPSRLSLAPGASEPVTVLVRVPATAEDQARADVFLQAVHQEDPLRRGLVRMVVDVDTDAEHDDDSARLDALRAGEVEDAPGLGLIAALGATVAALVVARRRP